MIPLAICCLAFLIKGVIYLTIGSPVPFVLSLVFLFFMVYIVYNQNVKARRMIRISGVLIALWGFSRLALGVLFAFVPLTEAHIQEQFTVLGMVFSLVVMVVGVYAFRNARTYLKVI